MWVLIEQSVMVAGIANALRGLWLVIHYEELSLLNRCIRVFGLFKFIELTRSKSAIFHGRDLQPKAREQNSVTQSRC